MQELSFLFRHAVCARARRAKSSSSAWSSLLRGGRISSPVVSRLIRPGCDPFLHSGYAAPVSAILRRHRVGICSLSAPSWSRAPLREGVWVRSPAAWLTRALTHRAIAQVLLFSTAAVQYVMRRSNLRRTFHMVAAGSENSLGNVSPSVRTSWAREAPMLHALERLAARCFDPTLLPPAGEARFLGQVSAAATLPRSAPASPAFGVPGATAAAAKTPARRAVVRFHDRRAARARTDSILRSRQVSGRSA